jgi:hypothetical protein
MKKVVEFDHCHSCPFEKYDIDSLDQKYYGKYACWHEDLEEPKLLDDINKDESSGIPSWCPLPNAKEKT